MGGKNDKEIIRLLIIRWNNNLKAKKIKIQEENPIRSFWKNDKNTPKQVVMQKHLHQQTIMTLLG